MGAHDGFSASTEPFYIRGLSICDLGFLGKGRGSWNQSPVDAKGPLCIPERCSKGCDHSTTNSMHLIERDLALQSPQGGRVLP